MRVTFTEGDCKEWLCRLENTCYWSGDSTVLNKVLGFMPVFTITFSAMSSTAGLLW